MSNEVIKTKVKATGELVDVYKLKSGGYQIFLGDKISVAKITEGEHNRSFTHDELDLPSKNHNQ